MLGKTFLLTFDWVVNRLSSFNQSQNKDKKMLHRLRYIFKLAAARGYKTGVEFFKRLCHMSLTTEQIRKSTKKLATFVSPEEMKLLISSDEKITVKESAF
ncbi:hypothetical protein [Fangia hongkongensis]|uniref:hypothetical protein n=1 Tax=Fangia hongkongensis TaxID=270495 RepID=UPI00037F8522|nr:hypothetical protein [Fangia hongkongensis]MBK2125029.1 hypothetical protein [Fangia hongkongensis]